MGRITRALTTATCVLVAGVMATTTVASAASRTIPIDNEFGTHDVVRLQQGSAVRDSELDGLGGMYVAGTVATRTGVFWRIEYLDRHGRHDPFFGTNGIVMFEARNANAYFVGMELFDGWLYLAGSDGQKGFTVMRLDPETGRVDRTFARRGQARATLNTRYLVSIADFEMADIGQGRVAVLGNLADPTSRLRVRSFVARFDVDPEKWGATLGTDLRMIDVTPGGKSQNLTQLAIDRQGRAIVAGSRIADVGQEMVVVRLKARRGLDESFATDGVRVIQPVRGAVSAFSSIVVNDDDSLTLGGWTRTGTAREPVQSVVVVRLTTEGDPDPNFNGDGIARVQDERFNDQVATDLAVDYDGSFLVSTSPVGVTAKPAFVVHVNENGALATRKGTNGVTAVVYVAGQRSWIQMIHVFNEYLYVLGGTAVGLGQPSGTIARFELT